MPETESRRSPRLQKLSPVIEELTVTMANLREAVQDADWSSAYALATRSFGLGLGALCAVGHDIATEAARGADLRADRERLARHLRRLAADDNRDAIIDAVRAALASSPERLAQLESTLAAVATGDVGPTIEALVSEGAPPAPDPRHELGIAAVTRGLLGLIHAEFNGAYDALADAAPPISKAFVDSHKDTLSDRMDTLRARQQAIHSALATNAPDKARDACHALSRWVQETVPPYAATQAQLVAGADALRRAGRGGDAERAGAVASKAALHVREALASCAAAHRLDIELRAAAPTADVASAIAAAATTDFDVRVPDGKNTPIAKLGDAADGDFVEIAGFASAFEVSRTGDDKLISRVELHDPSSDTRATAAVVFVHLPHAGVTTNAYCSISGLYKTASDLAGGQPAVEVDKLSVAQLAARGWRIALLRLAEPWFSVWRNSANLRWALGPHRLSEDDAATEGAGELIYTPFWRG